MLDKIMAKLTPDERQAVFNQFRLAEERGRADGFTANGWRPFFAGAAKSWTVWFGVLVAIWPQISEPLYNVAHALVPGVTESVWSSLTTIAGVIIVALRAKTDTPLEERARGGAQ